VPDGDVTPITPGAGPADLLSLGRRVRHLRQRKGWTLAELGAAVERAPSAISLIENGRREPRLSLLRTLAAVLGVDLADLLDPTPPTRRAALEVAVERAQRGPAYTALGLPPVSLTRRLPTDALEALSALQTALIRRLHEQAATPEEARRANRELRADMRGRDNYYPAIERAAAEVLATVGHTSGPLSHHVVTDIAAHHGFALHHVRDLPQSTRSVTDLRNHRIYLPQSLSPGGRDPRAIVLQALGAVVLGHPEPKSYGDFLRQRIETNYFAAALLLPERAAVELLQRAKNSRDLAVEDLRDAFAVSHEAAAHRFTNLASHHLGIPVHFMRVHENGTLYKAYENDGVNFPTDPTGAVEGQRVCRKWTARAVFAVPNKLATYFQYTDTQRSTFWCAARVEDTADGQFSVTIGAPFVASKWFRGRDTTHRATSTCPDPTCCRRPPAVLADQWSGQAIPSARAHSHLLAALPPGAFPGVDETELYDFLQRHAPAAG